jgi:AcrR family transcriptional regulator
VGIKERREREKQVTRQSILLAARQIARQEGWPALTIRKVAESIEYSPPMVYEYFASKEEILLELMREGFRQLTAAMQQARASTEDRQERLFRIVEAYWSFARSNPELYQIMNGLGGVPLDIQETSQAGRASGMIPLEALQDWARDCGVTLVDAFGATETLWSLIHGMVSLTMVDRIDGGEPRARLLLHQAIQDILFAWCASNKSS